MKTIKLGIFGLGRGGSFFKSVAAAGGTVCAVCERDGERVKKAVSEMPADMANAVTVYGDFDKFLDHDMDAVLLANCFHEHAPFAIKCLERGIHVLSECISNATMAEGVALVRAAEKSDAIYMLAENYPYMKFNMDMKQVYEGGTLGKFLYGEGEYNHPFDMDNVEEHRGLRPYPGHWRNYLPRSYYITHSLAPLMYVTGATPVRVTAMPVFAPFDEYAHVGSAVGDRAAIVTTLNDDDSVFKVTGCAAFGAHSNSYRICGTNGQIENRRGFKNEMVLRYNKWQVPEGMAEVNTYIADHPEGLREAAEAAGHGGGDFIEINEFFNCIREGRQPTFDVYFATACASVAILSHRSLMQKGVPYDIPDLRREEERKKYENDTLCPIPHAGREPDFPCCSHPDYKPTDEQYQAYLDMLK